jgi:anaerobic selenocysteine-containing dehydrogenase
MPYRPRRSWIERTAVQIGLIPDTDPETGGDATASPSATARTPLARFPSPDRWDDFIEHDPKLWPQRAEGRHYRLLPTTCFNCESACGLLAYVDKATGRIRKLEGNPLHPGSRGKNCAKGPATINQVNDPDRILTPMKRVGPRGAGQWEAVSWDEALADIGGRIRKALADGRKDEVVYHVGRPGAEGFIDRVLRAWGVDGHNSHTNICSSGARFGYALWSGYDRPSPDYANARFILALNAHLESGHYFNPHAQRISEGVKSGAKLAVVDPRLSNTASMAHYWLPTVPGTEAALLLAMARIILEEGLFDSEFIDRWVNWRESLEGLRAERSRDQEIERSSAAETVGSREETADAVQSKIQNPKSKTPAVSVDDFIAELKRLYADFTPEFAEAECGIPAETVVEIARQIGRASAHLGGWQVSRCLFLLHVLTGSVGTEGGCSPSAWNKYKADLINPPPPQDHWNELHFPREYPLAHYEMSFLLPHYLKAGRGRIDTYFTRVFNPVWTYPDGFVWVEALRDESKIGLHVALTPTWNETAFYADYVLPMGHGPERHDLNTYETHNGTWIAFRQPVLRAHARAEGREVRDTRDVNPGQVWEEDEFWIALCWAIDPDGSMGIRKYFESVKKPGEMLTVDEYYEHAFDRVPGLKEAAAKDGLSTLDYMRRHGAFEVSRRDYLKHEKPLPPEQFAGADVDPVTGVVRKNATAIGVVRKNATAIGVVIDDGEHRRPAGAESPGEHRRPAGAESEPEAQAEGAVVGFPTPSRKLEFFSRTMVDWGWPEHAIPGYIRSHVYGEEKSRDREIERSSLPAGEFVLLPTFRLPTLIHTRSGSAKWLNEISQRNPVWIHTSDAARIAGVAGTEARPTDSMAVPVERASVPASRLSRPLRTGDLVRVITDIGWFVDKCWVTEAIRPGVVACSHHLGRWRRRGDPANSRWSGSVVSIEEVDADGRPLPPDAGTDAKATRSPSGGRWIMRTERGPEPFDSDDPDSRRIWWRDGGVPQNLTFPVHPDPISGMHCWHQRVRVEPAHPGDRAGDVFVDTARSMEIYREWLKLTRSEAVARHNLRRPLWLNRPLRPTDGAYRAGMK